MPNDYISRKDAFDGINKRAQQATRDGEMEYASGLMDAAFTVTNVPASAVTPAIRSAWQWRKNGSECQACGHLSKLPYYFCPGCGADMRKDEERD